MGKEWEGFSLGVLPNLRVGYRLYDFQMWGVWKALSAGRYVLCFATGLGKTLSAYCVYFYWMLRGGFRGKLLVLTNKTAVLQFGGELGKFFDSDIRCVSVHEGMGLEFEGVRYKGYKGVRGAVWDSFGRVGGVDVVVMNHELFGLEGSELIDRVVGLKAAGVRVMFLCDEAAKFRNEGTRLWLNVRDMSGVLDVGCGDLVLGLTATVTKGKLEGVYGLFKGLGVHIARSRVEFLSRYCETRFNVFSPRNPLIVGYKNLVEFREVVGRHSFTVSKLDVEGELPEYTVKRVLLEGGADLARGMVEIYGGMFRGGDGRVVCVSRLGEVGYVRRALLDRRLVFGGWGDGRRSEKTEEILRMLRDDFVEEKVVIYTPSKVYLKELVREISSCVELGAYYREGVLEVSGDISAVGRERAKERFSADSGSSNVLVLNDAGLEALNLQAGNVLIVAGLPNSGGDLVQLAGRLSRLGSVHRNVLLVYLLIRGSQDEDEYLILNRQMELMSLVQGGESEAGLIDWGVLGGVSLEVGGKSKDELLLEGRGRRLGYYGGLYLSGLCSSK